MVHGLASLLKIDKRTDSRYEFYVGLCDLLLDLVEQDIDGPNASTFSHIAHSLGHDLLNITTLAGRLLWYEGVTPDSSRSPDLVAVGVDTENYLVCLRSACDVLAPAIAYFGVESHARGMIPNKSFNKITEWINKDKRRIELLHPSLRNISEHFVWFSELKQFRESIVHYGNFTNTFTDRVTLSFFLVPSGVPELQWLRGGYKEEEEAKRDKPRFTRVPLVPFLKRLTESLFRLTEQIAEAIEDRTRLRASQTHVLSGVYLPAIHHLLSYEPPVHKHPPKDSEEPCQLHINSWLLLKAGDYLSSAQRGYPNGYWWRLVLRLCALFPKPPRYMSSAHFDGWTHLIGWKFVFDNAEGSLALVLRDSVLRQEESLEDIKVELDKLAKDADACRAALIVRKTIDSDLSNVAQLLDNVIVEADPLVAAEKAFGLLAGS